MELVLPGAEAKYGIILKTFFFNLISYIFEKKSMIYLTQKTKSTFLCQPHMICLTQKPSQHFFVNRKQSYAEERLIFRKI